MKIRIKGNSVRYRLTKSEVETLVETGKLEDSTAFISGVLQYAIEQTDANELSADFLESKVTLHIPRAALQQWAATGQVGISNDMPLPEGGSLYLLLEKDFKCIDGDLTEDQSDYFENPLLNC